MQEIIQEIVKLTIHAGTDPTETAIPGVLIIKGDVPEHQLAAIYEPMIGFLVQGGKLISIGDQELRLKAPSYFVIPTELPATGSVQQGPNGQSYLSVGLRINSATLMSLMNDIPSDHWNNKSLKKFSVCPATPDFLDAWVRMLRLLKNPKDIPALAPVYEREILYRVLMGPEGERLRQTCLEGGKASKIRRAILWIRENYSKTLDVQKIAAKSGMAITTFHRQFKEITGLSPIQFQKQLRLLEARKLLVFSDYSVSETAFEVGYESASQFNREYSRLFGASPAKDALSLKKDNPSIGKNKF
jgi:AraC-like DNA-binding protein